MKITKAQAEYFYSVLSDSPKAWASWRTLMAQEPGGAPRSDVLRAIADALDEPAKPA